MLMHIVDYLRVVTGYEHYATKRTERNKGYRKAYRNSKKSL